MEWSKSEVGTSPPHDSEIPHGPVASNTHTHMEKDPSNTIHCVETFLILNEDQYIAPIISRFFCTIMNMKNLRYVDIFRYQ